MFRIKPQLPVLLIIAISILLAACGSQPTPTPTAATVEISSASVSVSQAYLLTGRVEAADSTGISLEYSVNSGDWQALSFADDGRFSVAVTLDEGRNTVAVALTSAEGHSTERALVVEVNTSGAPQIVLTSADHSISSSYLLTGVAIDDFGIDTIIYELGTADPEPIALDADGTFTVTLELAAGQNDITVMATDGGGNSNSASLTVTYDPQISAVSAAPMVAQTRTQVTLTGSNFGNTPGTVTFGTLDATVDSWADTEISVTVPRDHTGGWTDILIETAISNYTVESFFVGVEITDPDLGAAITTAEPAPGTAFLLSAADYSLAQTITPAPEDYLTPYSFYGASTDDAPTTTLSATNGTLRLATNPAFPVKFQDLNIEAQDISFMQFMNLGIANTGTQVAGGLLMENVRFTMRINPAVSGDSTFAIGAPGLGTVQDDSMPTSLYLNNVEIIGFEGVQLSARQVTLKENTIVGSNTLLTVATQGWLRMYDSSVDLATDFGVLIAVGTSGTVMERNTITGSQAVFLLGQLGLGPTFQVEVKLIDNVIEFSDPVSQILMQAGDNSVIRDLTATIGNYTLAFNGVRLDFTDNDVTVEQMQVQVVAGTVNVTDNRLSYGDGGMLIGSAPEGIIDYLANIVTGTGPLMIAAGNTVSVHGNEFNFTGLDSAAAPFRVEGQAPSTPTISFTDNVSTGSTRLFEFTGTHGDFDVQITGNTFNAVLAAPGDVAHLLNVTAPSAITTSDNVWGDLPDRDSVLALITATGSDPGIMTVAEF